MTLVNVQFTWEMGHRLPNHQGLCSRLHGHHYVLDVRLRGYVHAPNGQPNEGMVIDFADLKMVVRSFVERLDHRFMLQTVDPLAAQMSHLPGVILVTFVPTAENLVRYIADSLQSELSSYTTAWLHSVRLQETPNCYAEIVL